MAKQFGFNPSSFFSNIFYFQQGKENVYLLTDPNLGNMLSVFTGGYSESNMMVLAQSLPELHFVVNAVASRVKNGKYKLVDDTTGEEITDNKLWNKIKKQPNWQYTFDEFIWHAVFDRLVTGNRYGFSYCSGMTMGVKPTHKNIEALWLIPPHYTFIVPKTPRPSYLTTLTADEYIQHFHYTGGDSMMDIIPQYITHDIYMKVGDATDIVTCKGVSPFKAAEYPLSNLVAVYSARNVIYVKRGALGMMVSKKSDMGGNIALTPEEKKEAQKDMQERYGVTGNKNPVGITSQPLDYIKMGASIQELEPFKETEASCAALCGIIQVPIALMPKGSDAKFLNLDIAERNIYENVIFAEAESICAFFTKMGHFADIKAHVEVSFDHISALQDDALKFAQAALATGQAAIELVNAGMITVNEGREMIDREAVQGGDEFSEDEWEPDVDTPPTDEALPPDEDTVDVPGETPAKCIKLPKKSIKYLAQLAEAGNGYQVVNIALTSGKTLSNRVVMNGKYLKMNDGEKFTSGDILKVGITKQAKKLGIKLLGKKLLKRKRKSFISTPIGGNIQ